jgi:hypothetical protein
LNIRKNQFNQWHSEGAPMPANSMTTAGLKTSPAGRIDMRTVQERQKAGADRFKERSARAAEQTDKLQQLRGAWQLALQSKDIDTLKILNADFESAARESAQNTKDLSGMMFALLDGYKDIGVAIKAAEEFNTEEKKIMDDAAALVEAERVNDFGTPCVMRLASKEV